MTTLTFHPRDRSNDSRAASPRGRAEKSPQAISQAWAIESAAIESGAIEEDTRAAPTAMWNAFRVAVGIFGVYIVAATILAIVIIPPGLKLLGFFVAIAMMMLVGMPMLLATMSVAVEDTTAQLVVAVDSVRPVTLK